MAWTHRENAERPGRRKLEVNENVVDRRKAGTTK